MIIIHKISSFLVIVVLCFGCGKKDTSLLDQLSVNPVVNPNLKVLLQDAFLLSVQLDSSNMISGYTTKAVFRSSDNFASFNMNSLNPVAGANSMYENLYAYNGNTPLCKMNRNFFVYLSPAPSYRINFSNNYGSSWNYFLPQIEGTPYNVNSSWWIEDLQCLNQSTILLAVRKRESSTWGNDVYKTLLYKVNPSNHQGVLLSSIEGYTPKSIHFINDKVGWMLLNGGGSIVKTTDGGATWSVPLRFVATTGSYNLMVGSENNLFLYSYGDYQAYYSHDGGASWALTNTNFRYNHVVFGGANVLYALDGAQLLKSEDAGVNWRSIQDYTNTFNGVNRLFFLDDKQGLAYGAPDRKLYMTTDGGLNWKILMAAYPYIIQ
jgi:hypothetical protein